MIIVGRSNSRCSASENGVPDPPAIDRKNEPTRKIEPRIAVKRLNPEFGIVLADDPSRSLISYKVHVFPLSLHAPYFTEFRVFRTSNRCNFDHAAPLRLNLFSAECELPNGETASASKYSNRGFETER
jgi:hypothetical protein